MKDNREVGNKENIRKLTYVGVFLCLLSLSFILGRLSSSQGKKVEAGKNSPIIITSQDILKENQTSQEGVIIRGSSRGSKYYFPWCSSTFNEENTIYFTSTQDAEEKGYTLATNCIPIEN